MGYARAALMARGIAGWIAAGLPVEAGEGQAAE
jgi:rhodanese-related sulfurtransferase